MPLRRRGELGALWREHGLRDVSEDELTVRTRFASFDDYWLPFLEKQGPAGDYVAGLASDKREELRLQLRKRLLGTAPTIQSCFTRARGLCGGSCLDAVLLLDLTRRPARPPQSCATA
jgi:hypothetical protein